MKHKTLHMIGNAHIDPVWLWRWDEGMHEVHATFRAALDLMKDAERGDFIFTASSAAFYAWIEETDPQMFDEIKQRVAEGRWQIVGGWWIEPDCNIPCGESFVRQALYSQRYFKEKFGKIATVGYNPDSFGHNAMLPQILKKSGLDFYVFMRPELHEKELPARLFWWESPDGSRVLAYRIPFAYQTWGHDLETHVRNCADEMRDGLSELMCFYGVGNHGGGPTRENLESIRRLNQSAELPRLALSSPQRFFNGVATNNLPIVRDELQHHARGCYSAHSAVKRWNRQAEHLLTTAEKLSVFANLLTGLAYPADLSHAWKQILFNQFHDILAGTSLEAAYDDARDAYGEAMAIANRAIQRAVKAMAWNIHIPPEDGMTPLVVFNPHAWATRVPVEFEMEIADDVEIRDNAGNTLPAQRIQSYATVEWRRRFCFIADLPALGYRVYRVFRHPAQFESVLENNYVLENGCLRVELDPNTGYIKSLYDKQNAVEGFAGAAARPVVIEDTSDTWSHGVARFDHIVGEFAAKRIAHVEDGAVRSAIRVESEYGASRLIQEFILYRELNQLDVRVTVDWREQFKMLKLRFPVNVDDARATFEIPYGHIERAIAKRGEEEPGQSWIDVSGMARDNGTPHGLSIVNDGKYSLDVLNNDIGLTVLRSPIYAHHLPAVPDPERHYSFQDQGIQQFAYMLLPHTGDWKQSNTVRSAAELNQSPVVAIETFHADGTLAQQDSLVSVDRDNIVVSVIKPAEGNEDIILRAYETAHSATRATIRLSKPNRFIETKFTRSEIKTWRIPKDGSQPIVETNLLEDGTSLWE